MCTHRHGLTAVQCADCRLSFSVCGELNKGAACKQRMRRRERERRSDFIKHSEQKRVRTLDGGAGAGGAQQAGPLQAVSAPGSGLQTALIKQQMLVGGTRTSTHTKHKYTTTDIISSHINSMFPFLRQVGKKIASCR